MPSMKGSWVIPMHSSAKSLSICPMGIELLLPHGLGSRLLRSQYDGLGRSSFGRFCLLMEQPVSHERPTSDSRGLSNGLGSWLLSWAGSVC